MNRQWLMVAAVVGGLGLGAWALSKYAPPPEGAAVGQRAPDYRVVDLATGDTVALRSHNLGQVTLVNVWATWCAPCRAEMPSMERLYQDYEDRGFRIAAVSVDVGEPDKVTAFGTELGLTFDLLHDPSGLIQQAYRMIGVPQSFLLDRDGTIVFMSLGEEHWDSQAHRSRLEKLLSE
jgi:cytochrome c-type biogenesis protein